MGTYVREQEDARGDLVDIFYFCSEGCWRDSFQWNRLGPTRATAGGASPCAESDSADSDVYCSECGVLIHAADGRPTPIVVNLVQRPPIGSLIF